jgi:hypothetical protein
MLNIHTNSDTCLAYIPTLANFSFVQRPVNSSKKKNKEIYIPSIIPYTIIYANLAVFYSPLFKCLAKSLKAVIVQKRQWSLSA